MGVNVAVAVGVGVKVAVAVAVGVKVAVAVAVAVAVGVGDSSGVGVGVNVAVAVGVGVNVAVAVGVGLSSGVGVGVNVAVAVGVGVATVKPPAVKDAKSATPSSSVASVVTRMRYVPVLNGAAGVTVNVLFPLLATGGAAIATQVAKLSPDSWKLPLQDVLAVLVVTVAGLAAMLKVTLTVVSAGAVAPSVGTVEVTARAGFVVKPVAWSNCAPSGTPPESCAPVVTRTR